MKYCFHKLNLTEFFVIVKLSLIMKFNNSNTICNGGDWMFNKYALIKYYVFLFAF